MIRTDYLHKQAQETDDLGKFFLSASGAPLANPTADVKRLFQT